MKGVHYYKINILLAEAESNFHVRNAIMVDLGFVSRHGFTKRQIQQDSVGICMGSILQSRVTTLL
jgi:hypothetical protein